MLPDVPAFCADLTASLEELEQALGLAKRARATKRKARKRPERG